MNFTGFCRNQDIRELIAGRLEIFETTLDDIYLFITDSGSDVKKMVENVGTFHLLRLAYTVFLFADNFLVLVNSNADIQFDEDTLDVNADEETDDTIRILFKLTVSDALTLVSKVTKDPRRWTRFISSKLPQLKSHSKLIKPMQLIVTRSLIC